MLKGFREFILVLTAFALYFFIVPVNRMDKWRARTGESAPEKMSDEVRLLTEVRDGIARR
jgi:large-conductance mechanosensitive channel